MEILIATSVRMQDVNGNLYVTVPFASVLKRYYAAYGKVTLCTRMSKADVADEKTIDVTEMVKNVIPLNKLSDVLKKKKQKQICSEIEKCDMVVSRVPSLVAYKVAELAKKMKKPYYAEVIACAWDVYWNHSLKGKLLAPYMFFKMKCVTKKANYVLYVTNKFLQERYPTNGKYVGISDVKIKKIDDELVANRLQKIKNTDKTNITLMTSAIIDVKYKGQEYVIKAIKPLKEAGIHVTYKLVGSGKRERLLNIAKKYGVEDNVVFLGSLPHDDVFKNLDEADIYIQPSLTEGLPRALVEAISRGCICVGSRVGGIPELLQDRYLFKQKCAKDIVRVIKNICEEAWETIAKENFENAKRFEDAKLDTERNNFYKMVKEEIER